MAQKYKNVSNKSYNYYLKLKSKHPINIRLKTSKEIC